MLNVLVRIAPAVAMLVLALKVRQTLARFRTRGATEQGTALPLDQLGLRRDTALRILERRRVLVRIEGDRYFMDPLGYARWRRRRRIILSIVLPIVAVLLGAVVFLS